MINFGLENEEIKTAPFLIKAIEEENNNLKFIVALSIEGQKGTDIDDIGILGLKEVLAESTPIYPDENNLYEIVFEHYVLHQTRNESYTVWDKYEVRKGRYFIIFEKSRLLDYVPHLVEIGLVEDLFPNGYKHYGIYCQNHIIDIITTKAPVIKKCI